MKEENKLTCPRCHNENPEDSLFCISCGERLSTLEPLSKEEGKIVCPICHKENKAAAEKCIQCGQRFKLIEIIPKEIISYEDNVYDFKPKKHWGGRIFFILIILVMLIATCHEQLLSAIYNIAPRKIVSVNNMTTYINQNDKFQLPTKVGAKMNYGNNKAVEVNWESKAVDSSTVGNKTISGKINGYEKAINFSVRVLPNTIQESIGNYTVTNSLLELNIYVPSNIKWMWFEISKTGNKEDEVLPVKNGEVKGRVYLPYGAGDYEITTLTTTNNEEYGKYYVWKKIRVKNEDTRNMNFLMPSQYVQSDSEQIRNLAYKITEKSVTDYEKTRAIHDWVATNIAYDVAELDKTSVHSYSAIETLEGKKAVCNGYANLTAALNRTLGIKTKIIGGTAKNNVFTSGSKNNSHAWNEAYINGNWLIEDTTWDAGGVDDKTNKFHFRLSHKYFNPTASIFAMDHTKEDER